MIGATLHVLSPALSIELERSFSCSLVSHRYHQRPCSTWQLVKTTHAAFLGLLRRGPMSTLSYNLNNLFLVQGTACNMAAFDHKSSGVPDRQSSRQRRQLLALVGAACAEKWANVRWLS